MTRLKAFATHLGISFVIFLVILFFIVFEWYPPPFFTSDGGWQGIRIIIGVDLVLGPLLTLIVFKPGKPKLKLDLTIIGILQAGALSWGIWAVHHERPIATVFTEDHFTTVTAYQMQDHGMSSKKLQAYGSKAPYWIFSDLPTNVDEMQKIRLRSLQLAQPIYLFPRYYRKFDASIMQRVEANAINMSNWLKSKPADLKRYHEFVKEHGKHLVFVTWYARDRYRIVALNAATGKYVGVLDIIPPNVANQKAPKIARAS